MPAKQCWGGKLLQKCHFKKVRQEKLNKLELELENLERKNKDRTKVSTNQQITVIKDQINEIYTLDIQKKLTLLKQKYYKIGNKSAKLLAYKLKKQQMERVIYRIKD